MYTTDVFDKYLTQYRVYDPNTSRFIQRDPVGIIEKTNLYYYSKNNPSYFIDPMGLDELEVEVDLKLDNEFIADILTTFASESVRQANSSKKNDLDVPSYYQHTESKKPNIPEFELMENLKKKQQLYWDRELIRSGIFWPTEIAAGGYFLYASGIGALASLRVFGQLSISAINYAKVLSSYFAIQWLSLSSYAYTLSNSRFGRLAQEAFGVGLKLSTEWGEVPTGYQFGSHIINEFFEVGLVVKANKEVWSKAYQGLKKQEKPKKRYEMWMFR